MGIYGGATGNRVQFFTDIDVTFTMSGETDHGVTFGASIDLGESDGSGNCAIDATAAAAAGVTVNGNAVGTPGATCTTQGNSPAFDPNTQGGETIFVSGSFGTLTMGDTDGAFDFRLQEVGMAGSINDDETGHAGYNGNGGGVDMGFDGVNDGQVARYDYSFGDFGFSVSAELDDNGGVPGVAYAVGVGYSATLSGATIGLGLGYQGYTNASVWGASVDLTMDNGLRAIVNYAASSGTAVANTTHWGIGLGYTMDAISVAANYGAFSRAGAGNDTSGFGVAATYDLGGGMSLRAGYGNSNCTGVAAGTNGCAATGNYSTYSFGAALSF